MIDKATATIKALHLIAQGYTRVSRKHNRLSRIDRPDWREWSERKGYPADASWYRRVLSRDTMTVEPEVAALIPSAEDATYEYRPRKGHVTI